MSLSLEMVISFLGLFLTILVNIGAIAFFAGSLKTNQNHQKDMIEELKLNFKEHFQTLERKQDKHNSMIERQFITEGQLKVLEEKMEVANHRITDLEGVLDER